MTPFAFVSVVLMNPAARMRVVAQYPKNGELKTRGWTVTGKEHKVAALPAGVTFIADGATVSIPWCDLRILVAGSKCLSLHNEKWEYTQIEGKRRAPHLSMVVPGVKGEAAYTYASEDSPPDLDDPPPLRYA